MIETTNSKQFKGFFHGMCGKWTRRAGKMVAFFLSEVFLLESSKRSLIHIRLSFSIHMWFSLKFLSSLLKALVLGSSYGQCFLPNLLFQRLTYCFQILGVEILFLSPAKKELQFLLSGMINALIIGINLQCNLASGVPLTSLIPGVPLRS